MKKLLSKLPLLCLPLMMAIPIASCGGGGSGGDTPRDRVVQNLPDKLLYICDATIFVKDGEEKYVRQPSSYSSNRLEVYIKENLTVPVVFDTEDTAQAWISARINYLDEWVCADADDDGTPNAPYWHSNDKNCQVYHLAEATTRTGYSDVNVPYQSDAITITQLNNETVTVGSNNVECVVWDYIYNNESHAIYGHYRYWFAKDTGVFIQRYHSFYEGEELELELKATRYEVGVDMSTALASLETPRTKYVFDPKYH